MKQRYTSAATSINSKQLPATFKRLEWKAGTINADIGGGRFDNATDYLSRLGVENFIYDPFNRSSEHNLKAWERVVGKSATATVNNVLNVICERLQRDAVISKALSTVEAHGVAYFLIYEGNKSGIGCETSKGWQANKKTEAYLTEIRNRFKNVIRKGNLIIAHNL